MIDIAVGGSRHEDNWKNERISWGALVRKLSKVHKTKENYAQYMAAEKSRQDEIKDIGGFVGGFIKGGNRKKGSVTHRQIVSLDLDYANMGIWDTFCMMYDAAAVIHSTHKHSAKTPRFRIILPLSRPVTPEEYGAISRKIAGILGIRYFDPTTFQVERLMYWPSISADSRYYFEEQDGDFLDADEVLDSYTDWSDMSSWPQCPSEKKAITREIKKQEDPTQKKNIIGAFCRVYSISEAIEEFLEDVYEPSGENRYTYIDGSGHNGAVVYDDLFIYSNHGSDPISMQCCNAFDMVRIHLYGHLDKSVDTPTTKQESYKQMLQLVNTNNSVIRELGEFAGLTPGDWLGEMDVTKGGEYKDTIENLLLIIQNDEHLKGAFGFNEFNYREYILKPVPWDKKAKAREFKKKDDAGLRHYLEKTYGIFQISKTQDALDIALYTNTFHPVKEYFSGLVWDGVPRLDNILIEHFGADDIEYTRQVMRKTLVAAVARVYQPGIKFDYMLTLIGAQGLRKSSFFRELGGAWFSATLGNIHNKEAYENLQGVLIMEVGELAGLKKADVTVIKDFISKEVDRYRVAYGKRSEDFPRQGILVGTGNENQFLRDPTGGRRFWVVDVCRRYKAGTLNIDQVWSEAKYIYDNTEDLYLNDDLEAVAAEIQKEHAEVDERNGLIEAYLNMRLPEKWATMSIWERRSFVANESIEAAGLVSRRLVCVAEIWVEALKCELKDMTTVNTKYIHSLMHNMPGWEKCKTKTYPIYGAQRSYKRVGEQLDEFGKRKAKRIILED